ncbi:hypothetical protein EVAR_82896_1 [Eumeta japonica]|uniref:Uncharacterized protein n=1 Tax=Eumeta variegata TaxID=151549 RepID=A0A4C1YGE3_EUMVA|nr:hypothetical protein EVAR_82896_1 [Eumeta japonica]
MSKEATRAPPARKCGTGNAEDYSTPPLTHGMRLFAKGQLYFYCQRDLSEKRIQPPRVKSHRICNDAA